MTFDIDQALFDQDNYFLEEAINAYQDELMKRFRQSPEGQAILKG